MKREKQAPLIKDEVLDELLKQGRTAEDVNNLLEQFTKALVERAMKAEMSQHLGYGKHDPPATTAGTAGTGQRARR